MQFLRSLSIIGFDSRIISKLLELTKKWLFIANFVIQPILKIGPISNLFIGLLDLYSSITIFIKCFIFLTIRIWSLNPLSECLNSILALTKLANFFRRRAFQQLITTPWSWTWCATPLTWLDFWNMWLLNLKTDSTFTLGNVWYIQRGRRA